MKAVNAKSYSVVFKVNQITGTKLRNVVFIKHVQFSRRKHYFFFNNFVFSH